MLVALPLIDRVAGVAAAALAEEVGGVGEAPGVPDDVPDEVPEPDEVPDVPEAVLPPDAALCVPGALV